MKLLSLCRDNDLYKLGLYGGPSDEEKEEASDVEDSHQSLKSGEQHGGPIGGSTEEEEEIVLDPQYDADAEMMKAMGLPVSFVVRTVIILSLTQLYSNNSHLE